MRTLLCVCASEFGWEVAQWQGVCRKKAREFDKTFVLTDPSRGDLYADFAEVINPLNIIDRDGLPRTNAILAWQKDRVYQDSEQEFRRFGSDYTEKDQGFDILIHARNSNKTFKNYPAPLWDKVLEGLSNYRIASIGKKEASLHLPGTTSLLGIGINCLSRIMAKSGAVVGPSSGPIHLAQHCGTPVVSWADNKIYMGRTTVKDRLEKAWNPFGVPAVVLEDKHWKPKPDEVIEKIESFLRNP